MTDTAYILGRPEWGQPDDEAAEEYAASIGTSPEVADEAAVNIAAATLRADWAAAAAYYWAAAYAALVGHDYRLMRENARIAAEAQQYASPEGVLLAAIFGGCEKRAPERPVAMGRTLPADQVAQARAAVQAEMARHEATAAKAAAKRAADAQVERRSEGRDAAQARATEVAGKLAVGQTYVASLPYRLGKKSSGLCWVNGVLVAVPNVSDGNVVRITALRVGRSYGLKYEAEGELYDNKPDTAPRNA